MIKLSWSWRCRDDFTYVNEKNVKTYTNGRKGKNCMIISMKAEKSLTKPNKSLYKSLKGKKKSLKSLK